MTKIVNLNKEPYDVYIGRGSRWGNPFKIGKDGTRDEVIEKFRKYLLDNEDLLKELKELEGMTLGCHCKPKKCHGDILVELIKRQVWHFYEE